MLNTLVAGGDPDLVVTSTEAVNGFGLLLEQVVRGRRVMVTRYGRPIAMLVPTGEPGAGQATRPPGGEERTGAV